MSTYLLILVIFLVLLIGLYNKVDCYECYIEGCKDGLKTTINMFSYLLTFMICISLLNSSGIINYISNLFNSKYIVIIIQTIVRPLSSSSSLSIMLDNYLLYGVDSELSFLSTLINYVSDSTLYIVPFYCGIIKVSGYNKIIFLGLIVNYFSYFLCFVATLLLF